MMPIPGYARDVITHPLFKRLGRIKQCGTLHHAWPAATHTRLEHSLGTMHLAEEYSRYLGFRPAFRRTFGLASLLHDIGHGPFSHVFEKAIKDTPSGEIFRDHDRWRVRLVCDNTTLTAAIAEKNIDVFPTFQQTNEAVGDILAIWNDNPGQAMFLTPEEIHIGHALLAGVAGVDRMDYLLRDSYHTNPQHRIDRTAVQAIMHHTTIDLDAGTVTYTPKGEHYVQLLLEARAYMHREVYTHHRAIEADLAITRAFQWGLEAVARPCVNVLDFEQLTDGWVEQQAFDTRYLDITLPGVTAAGILKEDSLLDAIRGTTKPLIPCDPDDPDAVFTATSDGLSPCDLSHITNRWPNNPSTTSALKPKTSENKV
jgi:uncharacterized protein